VILTSHFLLKAVRRVSVRKRHPQCQFYLFFRFRVGFPLRFVFAILRSSALLIDLYIPREAPLSDDFERLPRFAASAAPAAICCFFDFAGIPKLFVCRG
jgi:hypothetical protein